MDDPKFTYTASLVNLPKITFSDVHRLTEQHSITARSKVDKGYSFFFENFIYDYEGESCTTTCGLHRLSANMASTKDKGSLPDPQVLSLGKGLKNLRPQPLISSVLHGLSQLSMVDSRFGPVPRGSPLSYQCPPVVKRGNYVQHPDTPTFPKLPLEGSTFPTTFPNFDPNSQQFLHFDILTVTHEMAAEREEQTREQSECPLWQALRKPRVTASRFYEVSHVKGPSSGQTLAGRILKGVGQTPAMKRGLEREPQVLEQYSKHFNVNVSRCGFVIHPDAPHLGASPDARVYDPSAIPCFGLAEVKCPDISSISEAGHVKMVNGQAKLKQNHKYHWQVQGQLAITGLSWCDFITDTEGDFTVERVWRDDEMIKEMKKKVDLYFFGTYMNVYLQQKVK
ncbi:unnamed protein product [Leuciscus chuanchicus]